MAFWWHVTSVTSSPTLANPSGKRCICVFLPVQHRYHVVHLITFKTARIFLKGVVYAQYVNTQSTVFRLISLRVEAKPVIVITVLFAYLTVLQCMLFISGNLSDEFYFCFQAGVEEKIDLRLQPASKTLGTVLHDVLTILPAAVLYSNQLLCSVSSSFSPLDVAASQFWMKFAAHMVEVKRSEGRFLQLRLLN